MFPVSAGTRKTRRRKGIPVNGTVKKPPEGSIFRAGDAGRNDFWIHAILPDLNSVLGWIWDAFNF
jgi:hypothetical protein